MNRWPSPVHVESMGVPGPPFSGRQTKRGKTGKIPDHLAPILERVGVQETSWYEFITEFNNLFSLIAGTAEEIEQIAETVGRRWFKGIRHCRRLFPISCE